VPTPFAVVGEVLVTSGFSDITGENMFAVPADVEMAVEASRHSDAIPVCGEVETVNVEAVLVATECQQGTNLLPIGSSLMLSCCPILPAVFAKLVQYGSKPFVNLTGAWAMSGRY